MGEKRGKRCEGMQSKASSDGVKKCIMDARLLIKSVPDNIWLLLSCKGVQRKTNKPFPPLSLQIFSLLAREGS